MEMRVMSRGEISDSVQTTLKMLLIEVMQGTAGWCRTIDGGFRFNGVQEFCVNVGRPLAASSSNSTQQVESSKRVSNGRKS